MSKAKEQDEKPLEALILENKKDKYKLAYASIRWAKEIKQKENLPDAVPFLVPRAVREILTGKVTIKEIEKLPMIVKVAPPPAAEGQSAPTITLNPDADEKSEKSEKKDKKEK
jgi:DNA-directed RNA polymerase subunit K/omega